MRLNSCEKCGIVYDESKIQVEILQKLIDEKLRYLKGYICPLCRTANIEGRDGAITDKELKRKFGRYEYNENMQ